LLKVGNLFLTLLFAASYVGLWAYTLCLAPLEIKEMVMMLFVPLLTLVTVSVLRMAVERPRPYAENGAGIVPLVDKKKSDNRSFPSRHLACAAAIAMTFLPFYPLAGGFLLICSILLGYTRFALGVHYPSDLFAGMSIGMLLGGFMFIL
jgi:membrane-associated phospholipid phosphatase